MARVSHTADRRLPGGPCESGSAFVLLCDVGADGPRVAVKDVIDIAGWPTRAGSRALEAAAPAAAHAEVVARLLASGCRIVGKTKLHELAYGVTGLNAWAGTPLNPAFPALIPGGSSSGSAAAVAAGLVDFALGTDTGGSIRVPAACCGIYGLKPSFGRLPRAGLTPRRSSLDCVGPLAASAAWIARAMRCLDPGFNTSETMEAARVGWIETGAEPALARKAQAAARRLDPLMSALSLPTLEAAHQAALTIIARETFAAFGGLLESGAVGADVATRLAKAGAVTDESLAAAEAIRSRFTAEVDRALDPYDVLALPTLPSFPPRLSDAGDLMQAVSITALCRPFNLSGHPAISIPVGVVEGRPASLQLVARRGADERLVALAALVEGGECLV